MAPAEICTIAENEHGSAFEVKIKSPGAEKLQTAAKLRLESYVKAPKAKLPKLGAKKAEERANKAKQQNEQKKEAAERVKVGLAQTQNAKRHNLAEQLAKAQGLRQGALSTRKQRAAQHYEKVLRQKGHCEQQLLLSAHEAKQRLSESLTQKETLRGRTLAEITNRATKHNEKVAKVQEQQQALGSRESLQLPAAERLMDLSLRLCEHHCPVPSDQ